MEKVECKACSATVDKSIEFCSSCGEWLGLSIKDIENTDAKTEPEVTRRVRPPEELLSQPLSNYGATSLPTRNEVPGIRAVFFLAIIIPLIAAASYYYNQNIAEEVIEEIQVVEQSTTTSTSTTVQSLLQLQYPFSCSSSSSLGEGWSCEKIYDDEPSSWQDNGLECADATLEFTFSKDIYFQFLTYENIEDSKSFKRNFKPRDILITSEEEGFSIEYELENQNTSSQWIDLNTSSSVITIQILSAYPGKKLMVQNHFSNVLFRKLLFMDVDKMDINSLKSQFSKYKKDLLDLNKYMYENPELGYQEIKSVNKITKLIKKHTADAKFKKFTDIPTAFTASINKKPSKENIAICIEYDALPNVGHACGHNLISSIGLGAFFILSNYIKDLDYEIRLVGCPAEEIIPLTYENGGGGGKIKLLDQGAFDNTAYSVMIHPATRNEVDPLMIAVKQIDIEYFGKAAHASGSAYVGKNALDAQILAYNNISALRQQLQPVEKVHGIITHGGESPNIIPDYTRSSWMIRAQKTKDLNRLEKKIINCFKGAAESTGCKLNIVEGNGTYENLVTDKKLKSIFMENSKKLSLDMKTNESYDQSKNGSTDFGNISKQVPSLHAFLQIVDDDGKIVNHQPEFAHATVTKRATDMIETGSVLLASTILDL